MSTTETPRERCPDCDRPIATEDDLASSLDGVCMVDYNLGNCPNERVDWRARALEAEAREFAARDRADDVLGDLEAARVDLAAAKQHAIDAERECGYLRRELDALRGTRLDPRAEERRALVLAHALTLRHEQYAPVMALALARTRVTEMLAAYDARAKEPDDIPAADLLVEYFRAPGRGVNEAGTGVRITHVPTGIVVGVADGGASRLWNKAAAIASLRAKLRDHALAADLTLTLRLGASDDPELTCLVCSRAGCDLAAPLRGEGRVVTVGFHARCVRREVKR